MSIVASNVTFGASGSAATSYATASVAPSANQLLLLSVVTRTNITADPNIPTVTGNGLTWVQVGTTVYDNSGASRKRLTLFRAMGGSPSTGAITIDEAGQTQTNAAWVLDTFTGMDTTGTNGSGAIVQAVSNQDVTGTATSLTVTLAAFGSTNNSTYGVFGEGNNVTMTAGTGFSVVKWSGASGNVTVTSEFQTANDTSADATDSFGASELGGIAVEIKIAAVAAATNSNFFSFF